jgi:deoxyribonuclease-4
MTKESETLRLGAHTSAAGGVHNALYEAASIGANITQFFTANQRRWQSPDLAFHQIELWKKAQDETGIFEVMSHDSYLINLAAPDEENWQKSMQAMRQEIKRCRALGVTWLNFHPGSYVGSSEQEGLDKIVASLKALEPDLAGSDLWMLLEATAGQGTQLGYRFEHLAYILKRVKGSIRLGVCVDTCHAFAAGYDLRGYEGWKTTFDLFDQIVGLEHLKALHVNDSLKALGKRVDRHAALGQGCIGWESFEAMVLDPRTRKLPMFLETPLGNECWREEIKQLRHLITSSSSII